MDGPCGVEKEDRQYRTSEHGGRCVTAVVVGKRRGAAAGGGREKDDARTWGMRNCPSVHPLCTVDSSFFSDAGTWACAAAPNARVRNGRARAPPVVGSSVRRATTGRADGGARHPHPPTAAASTATARCLAPAWRGHCPLGDARHAGGWEGAQRDQEPDHKKRQRTIPFAC